MKALQSIKQHVSQPEENELTPLSGLYLRETLLTSLSLSIIPEVPLSRVFDMQYTQISSSTQLVIQKLNIDVQIEGFDEELMPEEMYPDKRSTGHYC